MFKYYKIPNIDTAKKIIGKNPTIKFSPAYDLNDPFELKFNLKIDPKSEINKELYFKNTQITIKNISKLGKMESVIISFGIQNRK